MRIDSAIEKFVESYDREALESVDTVSKNFGLEIQEATLPGFNITESFNLFSEYLRGYAKYKINNTDNPKASPQSAICEAANRFIDTRLFTDTPLKYPELPGFVRGYVEGVNSLLQTIDEVKTEMADAEVQMECIGDVNDFVDKFMESLDAKFAPTMNKILWASGYNSRQRLMNAASAKKTKPSVVFV